MRRPLALAGAAAGRGRSRPSTARAARCDRPSTITGSTSDSSIRPSLIAQLSPATGPSWRCSSARCARGNGRCRRTPRRVARRALPGPARSGSLPAGGRAKRRQNAGFAAAAADGRRGPGLRPRWPRAASARARARGSPGASGGPESRVWGTGGVRREQPAPEWYADRLSPCVYAATRGGPRQGGGTLATSTSGSTGFVEKGPRKPGVQCAAAVLSGRAKALTATAGILPVAAGADRRIPGSARSRPCEASPRRRPGCRPGWRAQPWRVSSASGSWTASARAPRGWRPAVRGCPARRRRPGGGAR